MRTGAPQFHRNLWALTVLGLLRERAMHPYEMQRLIRDRHKDEYLNLKRGSLYHAIERLEKAGLIEPVETSREGRRPERTTYQVTEAGVDELLEWLRELLSRPSPEPTEFQAAVGHLAHLPPGEVVDCLQSRATMLGGQIAALESVLANLTPVLGPLVLLEDDLERSSKQAERSWVCRLIEDLQSGVYAWDPDEILRNPGTIPGARQPTRDEVMP